MTTIKTSTFAIKCDGPDDCYETHYGTTFNEALASAMDYGWAVGGKGKEHYCLAHANYPICQTCDRPMYHSSSRRAAQFPPNFTARNSSTICTSCVQSVDLGRSALQRHAVEEAADQYAANRSQVYRDFVQTTSDNEVSDLLNRCLERYGQEELVGYFVSK